MNNPFKLTPSPENSKEFKRLIQTRIDLDKSRNELMDFRVDAE